MKPTQVISLCAAATVVSAARESITNHLNVGICRSPLLPPSFPPLSNPVCGLVSNQHGHHSHRHGYGHDHGHDEDDYFSSGSPASSKHWTYSSPCARNGTKEYCVYSDLSFAGNRGVSIITTPKRAAYFSSLPAFTDPETVEGVNRDLDPDYEPVYQSVKVPGKGIGLVAMKPMQRGDRIMSATASIMIDYGAFEALQTADVHEIQAAAIDFLPSMHRAKFMNLSTHSHTEGHYQTVDRILATNAFDVENNDDEEDGFYVVFPEISRMNHDCRPNADYYYDAETLTQHIHAVRPIAIGEEITLSYMDPLQNQADRLAKLSRTWGFPCGCSLCTQSDEIAEASDARLEQMAELRREFHDYSTESRATPQMAELMVSLYQQERLDLMLYEAFTYAAIEWNGVGEPWLATKYGRLAIEYGLASVGPRDTDVVEMQALVLDPWKHWSWMLRTSKRMSWGKKREA